MLHNDIYHHGNGATYIPSFKSVTFISCVVYAGVYYCTSMQRQCVADGSEYLHYNRNSVMFVAVAVEITSYITTETTYHNTVNETEYTTGSQDIEECIPMLSEDTESVKALKLRNAFQCCPTTPSVKNLRNAF